MSPALPNFEREVRFALVLYGGASLAIYIHGVTQEFFHLVRSTAVDAEGKLLVGDAELSGTERVYRKLASASDGTVNTRFLVDIASGTSAGGINAIFLGKAFANGQTLDQVSRLWLDQADIQDLLNRDKRPRSLLSSQTMYTQLLDALSGMERDGTENSLQAEMDVFITATDIQGLELPIQLADKTVFEKRHKNVFHLRFGDGENHFAQERNAFLAFAARATSAFPFAFEPACLGDIQAQPFFPDYGNGYATRAFGDGGYLNNKPFTHAIRALSQRSTDLPVTRKLMYVEPSPDLPDANQPSAAPNFLRNTVDALITLPREETIREDLQRVIERNQLIERVQEITSHLDADVKEFVGRLGGAEYQRRTLADEIRDRGPGYAGYHRLKVRAVTDDLAAMLGQPSSVVDAWRREHYSEQDPERSESAFLLQYDLRYRERRIQFLLRKLSDPDAKRKLNRIVATLKSLRRPDATAEAIADRFREAFIRAAVDAEACLDPDARRIFDQFEYYDQIAFPIFYEASVGEAELCEVFRISPRDATSIVDENAPTERRRKLAGTALFHFGAFLNREWRQNDLMWGRLDAAERIIRAILPPDSPQADALIEEATLAVAGNEEDLKRLRETYEVNRKLPVVTRLKLAFAASRILLKMVAAYFTRTRQ
ncbi:MAG: patatin-like protein [Acidobacteriia bacterium]|nr:patatin-like protein [Terriglobia bacterium]